MIIMSGVLYDYPNPEFLPAPFMDFIFNDIWDFKFSGSYWMVLT